MDDAFANGHFNVVKFLCENRTEGCTTFGTSHAIRFGRYQAHACTTATKGEVAQYGRLDIVNFLSGKVYTNELLESVTEVASYMSRNQVRIIYVDI
ncbi:hypothetical protein THRCLA_20366 [Thraustotheca clavata]|uniref:Uncharacterized protein n=1 Tax=Thraustotheca clavata TaxID=74557 RepID=A0A1W0A861_9STRA|nr:hypothetical protein THRCLA_20366 [Thraustotheca clavata]